MKSGFRVDPARRVDRGRRPRAVAQTCRAGRGRRGDVVGHSVPWPTPTRHGPGPGRHRVRSPRLRRIHDDGGRRSNEAMSKDLRLAGRLGAEARRHDGRPTDRRGADVRRPGPPVPAMDQEEHRRDRRERGHLGNCRLRHERLAHGRALRGFANAQGAPTTSKGNFLAGGLFWALLPMVTCSVVGYRRAVGREQFWRDVRGLPLTLVGLVRRDGAQGRVHLLWGCAIALVASLVVSPAAGAVLGIGLLMAAPSVIGQMISSLISQIWQKISNLVARRPKIESDPLAGERRSRGFAQRRTALSSSFMILGARSGWCSRHAMCRRLLFIGNQAKPQRNMRSC